MWVLVILLMRMDRTLGSAKQTTGFMGCEVRNDFRSRDKVIGDPAKCVGLHHRGHNFFVYCERNKHAIPFDDSRPVLVAQGMA
jgi:hypothetical protein